MENLIDGLGCKNHSVWRQLYTLRPLKVMGEDWRVPPLKASITPLRAPHRVPE